MLKRAKQTYTNVFYTAKLPKFPAFSVDKIVLSSGIIAASASAVSLYTTYSQSEQFSVAIEHQAKTTELVAASVKQQAVQTSAQGKRIDQINSRLIKLEQSKIKAERIAYRTENHNRVVKKLGRVPTAVIYKTSNKLILSKSERYCLQKNVYHEAAFEPDAGMLAVAQVTGNRVASKHRGDDFCSVIYAPKQFSWTIKASTRDWVPSKTDKNWIRAGNIVKRYENGERIRGLEKSEFYYARYIKSPAWSRDMQYTHYLGEHLFLNSKS